MPPPDALLFISGQCPHCPAMLAMLADFVKAGDIGRLEVVNIGLRPEIAAARDVRTVPWLVIGPFELTGARTRGELETWIARARSESGMADYFHTLLKEGELATVIARVKASPGVLGDLLPIVANPEASLNVRIGAGAVFEEMAGTPAISGLVPRLGELSGDADARVRADACHLLGLTGAADARHILEARRADPDADVREIAAESLDLLPPPAP